MNAPGSGSRARTRELGYADAMRDMWHLLDRQADAWRESEMREAEDGCLPLAALYGRIAAQQERFARYAFDVHVMLIDGDATYAKDVQHRDWLERDYGHELGYAAPGPRELPDGTVSG